MIWDLILLGVASASVITLLYHFIKERHKAFLYLFFTFSIGLIMELISFLEKFTPIHFENIVPYIFTFVAFFLVLYVNAISNDELDAKILLVLSVFSVAAIFETVFELPTFPVFQNLLIWFNCILWIYFSIVLFFNSPKRMKFHSAINMAGALVGGSMPIILFLAFQGAIPTQFTFYQTYVLIFAFMLLAISFGFQPSLAYILPFKALRLVVLDTEGGIPLFSYTWEKGRDFSNEDLFSSMMQGVTMIMKESVKRGNIREIILDEAVLIIQQDKKFPVACILVAAKSSRSLRNNLKSFTDQFFKKYASILGRRVNEVSQFEDATELVEKCFPHHVHGVHEGIVDNIDAEKNGEGDEP